MAPSKSPSRIFWLPLLVRAFALAVSAGCGSPCACAKVAAISTMHISDNSRDVIRVIAKDSCLLPTAVWVWWRRRELNPDPKANAEGLYMLICFSFRFGLSTGTIFAHRRVSEAARPRCELVRLNLAHCHGPKQQASSSV